ncbi:hypothetical protein CUR178_05371 [Leishmania enriettii]|uniref:Uncharacterized protein n=1 Tax=Leishmania enriettii TaxID=5663 RepID=A0A836KUM7_LEIEN|nr:hypothetical protein CUR178_05371 [Leishmania enriettii]
MMGVGPAVCKRSIEQLSFFDFAADRSVSPLSHVGTPYNFYTRASNYPYGVLPNSQAKRGSKGESSSSSPNTRRPTNTRTHICLAQLGPLASRFDFSRTTPYVHKGYWPKAPPLLGFSATSTEEGQRNVLVGAFDDDKYANVAALRELVLLDCRYAWMELPFSTPAARHQMLARQCGVAAGPAAHESAGLAALLNADSIPQYVWPAAKHMCE